MCFNNKWFPILLIISGIMVALSNAYLFLQQPAIWQGIMVIVGIGWIWIGIDGYRRFQNTQPK
jgi:hypothetical protein